MNTISLLLSCHPNHPIDSFDWGVAELSSILYRGVTYDHVEVDFIEGEIRFYKHWNDKDIVHNVPTLRRFINAAIQNCQCSRRAEPTDPDSEDETPTVILHSDLLPHEIPGVPAEAVAD